MTIIKYWPLILREFLVLIISILMACLLLGFIAGFDKLQDEQISVNLHDTYLLFTPFWLIVFAAAILLLVINLVRQVWLKFRDSPANLFLTASATTVAILYSELYTMLQYAVFAYISGPKPGWTVKAPLTVGAPPPPQEPEIDPYLAVLDTTFNIRAVMILLAVLLAIISGYQMRALKMKDKAGDEEYFHDVTIS